ncbi:hypothetical protein K501DRAFT_223902, partial [Backusella circina FSU 941]
MDLPNVHPSHRPSMGEDELGASFSERVGSFIGSYSRTSMMHMAENVVLSETIPDEEDDRSSTLSDYLPRYTDHNNESAAVRRRVSNSTLSENTPLFPSLHKVSTCTSVMTAADSYPVNVSIKSTFLQSTFNSINILIGVAILTLPVALKDAGWIPGGLAFIFCFGLTNYTAKVLAKCLDTSPDFRTYGDVGYLTFGMRGRVLISAIFLTELVACSVALVVLLTDGLESLFPGFDRLTLSCISFLILTPTLFIPVRHLSYTSLLGILSTLSLVGVVIYDGVTKLDAPGSLHEPADTRLFPSDWTELPMSFGLIMAGFAGHAVFPTIYREMQNPKQYTKVVNYSYSITVVVYLALAVMGYIMFGSSTMQELTQNLMLVPEYNQTINRLAVYLVALNPIAKYGLTLNPIMLSWQISLLGNNEHKLLKWLGVLITSCCIVWLSYVFPHFDRVMGVLGAFFSFFISGIFPLVCHQKLFVLPRWQKVLDYSLLVIGISMAVTGTLAALFKQKLP